MVFILMVRVMEAPATCHSRLKSPALMRLPCPAAGEGAGRGEAAGDEAGGGEGACGEGRQWSAQLHQLHTPHGQPLDAVWFFSTKKGKKGFG